MRKQLSHSQGKSLPPTKNVLVTNAQPYTALAFALGVPLSGLLITATANAGTCTISSSAITDGQTAECSGSFTQTSYSVPTTVKNVTVINHGDWSATGNLPSQAASLLGPLAPTSSNNTGLRITNYGNLSWTNASATSQSSIANRTMAVLGTYIQNASHGSTYINHGSITATAATTAMATLAGIGNVGRSGSIYSENTGKIDIDVSKLTNANGAGVGMLTFAGGDVGIVNTGDINVTGGNRNAAGLQYMITNMSSPYTGYTAGTAKVVNSGNIDVSTTGGNASGIYYSVTDANATFSDGQITNTGSLKVHSDSGQSIGMKVASNVASVPIRITNQGEILSSGHSIFTTAGSLAPIHISNSGTLVGDVLTQSAADIYHQENGILAGGLALGAGSDIANFVASDLSQTTLLDGGDDVSDADGSIDTLTLSGLSATLAGANLQNWERILFDNASITFSDTALTTGSTDGLGLSIENGSTASVGNAFALTGNLSVGAGSVFKTAGNGSGLFSVSGNLNNSGHLLLSGQGAGDTLTIAGNYHGAGGTVVLDTVLGDDASPTDRLVIQGDSSGSSLLRINNLGGNGALTSEGIKLIDVAGSSNGTFSLLGDYSHEGAPAVVGGAYAYKLYQGGRSTPTDGNWYLRSELAEPVPEPQPQPGPGPQPQPLYQAGVPVYESYPQILLGLNGLPTLQQRVGNRYWSESGMVAQDPAVPAESREESAIDGNAGWVRVEGGHSRLNPRTSTATADYEYDTYRLQAGIDGVLAETANGRLFAGLTTHYLRGSAKIESPHDSNAGRGEIRSDGYGIGATLTWYGENGFYVDGQAQATWYDSDLKFAGGHRSLTKGNDGFGYALSVEGGKRIPLNAAWSLTPQAQLVYSRVDFDDFEDIFKARVDLDKGDSLQGRLGISLDHESAWRDAKGQLDRAHVYGITNLYHEFLDGTEVDVANVSFASKRDRLWGDIGLGGSYSWNDGKYTLFAEALANTSLNHFGDSYAYKGTFGIRVKW